jgi:hypothetical protein
MRGIIEWRPAPHPRLPRRLVWFCRPLVGRCGMRALARLGAAARRCPNVTLGAHAGS